MKISPSLRADFLTYLTGYGLAIVLTGISFAFVFYRLLAPEAVFAVILFLALIQIIVHLRCFLHISLKQSSRSDLQLILFSALIIALMVCGTLIVVLDQKARMM
ncbi:MAG: cytochrome-c oxidase [Proteobacteria bacterium]|nr:cytochrome-c oxidase [Pseudomonadota bacterium]